MKVIQKYEYDRLYVGEEGFNKRHWKAFVALNSLHDDKYFKVLHNGLQFNQFVGVLQVDGLLVEIHPKADRNDADEKWKGVLLEMLKACGRLKAQTTGSAIVRKQHLNLLEVYFEYFLRELEFLIHNGLVKKYRRQTGNVKALKGKLEFAGQIRKNLIHKERFYTNHQVYDANHLLHQILGVALNIVGKFTASTRLNDLCKRIQLAFPEVRKIKVNTQLFDRIIFNRKTAVYERALELARLIILNYSPDITSGREKMLSLLFDMNVLWEEYILTTLKKYVNKENLPFEVYGQESKPFWGYNSLRPDLVIRNKETKQIHIVDTKWKCPGTNKASVQDLRQIYAYCRYWSAEKGLLLYPGSPIENNFQSYEVEDYYLHQENETKEIKHQCKLGYVSVLDGNQELNKNIGRDVLKLLEFKDGFVTPKLQKEGQILRSK